jgi:hypothetical protein
MTDQVNRPEPSFHLRLDEDEVGATAIALRLLVSEERHEPPIRPLARDVLAGLEEPPDDQGIVSVPVTPQQMKITHTAVKVLFDDLQRDQAAQREVLRGILGKFPDEHTLRAIRIE